ncbi:TetR/AcrR family transcriptional regulator [Curtobacterium sp. MCJR17_055]|uniref:TetR/AcrR family transcriptional regulator n=1 Tax=unclassified Curtobacterium TaxID=257496 RepID=UPI000D9FB739|nr:MULTISPECIES: TetR/AcrR family transcriptional regulator [unclassified Curtobacterium]PYY34626.1 TetR/AcrR family transcriptional regulator [Curtobacterium sp. MCBD17_029]PYY40214.1 TetR/AcrR family transcriptional regulator [Curtobacterium sp. MCPF17_046]PYY48818.1 TetR/AcrR family transcriptional regulator [Curtobacterium sp. MCBD17_023]PYY57557.1 TetR/AcrR family transcriptional regulator [Curtobacterium sp. MCPF17_015]PYY58213.1 TetR/AcrR family transcriptional regulator [Curtobacterium
MTVDSPQPTVQRLLGQRLQGRAPSNQNLASPDGSSVPPAPRSGGAKVRILETATRLFYEEGIHGVGVDRLISEASVTKATFYKHYGSKDNLILAYVREQHTRVQAWMESVVGDAESPQAAVRAWVDALAADVNRPDFRGCAFLNAAAEYHDPRDPVRQVVAVHRDWYTERLGDLLQAAGHPLPGDGADELMLARDGAMSGAYAGDAIAATAALNRVAERVLAA